MIAGLLGVVGTLLPILPALVALVGGQWALRAMRRSPINERSDRRLAMWLGLVLGGVLAALAFVVVASIAQAFGASALLPVYAALGVALWAVVFLAGMTGYVALAAWWHGVRPILGVPFGVAIFVFSSVTGLFAAQSITTYAGSLHEADIRADIAGRSATVSLAVSQVAVETTSDRGTVTAVRLHVTLHTDVAIELDASAKSSSMRVQLIPNEGRNFNEVLYGDVPPGSPSSFAAGSDTTYDLDLRYPDEVIAASSGTFRAGVPGRWLLQITFVDLAGADYLVELPIDVAPA